jgi:outer membrane protein assembly factor BamB/tetratricopeptide (TPR) repeat protein
MALAIVFLFPGGLSAQLGEQNPAYLSQDEFLTSLFQKARRLESSNDERKAVETYLKIEEFLWEKGEKDPTTHYFLPLGEGRFISAEVMLEKRLGALSPEALKSYRTTRDPKAKVLFDAASVDRNIAGLRRLVRRYGYTSYGERALMLLGDLHFERGSFWPAALCWSRLLRQLRQGGADSPALLLKLLVCFQKLHVPERAEAIKKRLEGFGGRTVRLAGRDWPVEEVLKKIPLPGRTRPMEKRWGTFGGNAAHARRQPGGVQPGGLEFSVEIKGSELTEEIKQAYHRRALPLPLLYQPVRSGDFLLFSDSKSLWALNLPNGRTAWTYSAWDRGTEPERLDNISYYPTCDVDRAYATLNANLPVRREGQNEIVRRRDHHLVCLDLLTGWLLWDSAQIDDLLSYSRNAEFMTSPLLFGDTVYVGVTIEKGDFQSLLLALRASDGALRWKTFVCSKAIQNYLRLGVECPPPACSGDRLFFAPNLGVVAALDPFDGRLLWAYRYSTYPRSSQRRLIHERRRWNLDPPIVDGDRLLVTPQDGNFLFALHTETGRELWRFPRDRFRYMLGLSGRHVILVGRDLIALDLTDGKVAWFAPLEDRPRGRGVATEKILYVPGERGIHCFDASSGKLLSTNFWLDPKAELGNLLLLEDRLVSISAAKVNRFADHGKGLASLLRTARESPERPGTYLSLGRLYARRDRLREALKFFDRAIKEAGAEKEAGAVKETPTEKSVARKAKRAAFRLCYRKLLEAESKGDATAVRAVAARALRYAEPSPRTLRLIAIQAGALEEAGEAEKALHLYHRMIAGYGDQSLTVGPGYEVNAAAIARSRIRDLLRVHGRGIYTPLEAEAEKLYKTAEKTGTPEGYKKILNLYPNSRRARDVLLALAEFYGSRGLTRIEIEYLGRFYRSFPDDLEIPGILIRLAVGHMRVKRHYDAKKLIEELLKRYPDKTVIIAGKKFIVKAWAEEELRRPEIAEAETAAAKYALALPLARIWRTGTNLVDEEPRILVSENMPAGLSDYFFIQAGDVLQCRLVDTGFLMWRREIPGLSFGSGVGFSRGSLVVSTGKAVFAIDPIKGSIRWRYVLKDEEEPQRDNIMRLDSIQGFVATRQHVGLIAYGYDLICLRGEDGKELWQKSFKHRLYGSPLLVGDRIFIHYEYPARILGYKLASGEKIRDFAYEKGYARITVAPRLAGDYGLFVVLGGQRLVMLDRARGEIAWEKKIPFWVRKAELSPDGSYLAILPFPGPDVPKIIFFDARHGHLLWEEKGEGGRATTLFFGEDALFGFYGDFVSFELRALDLQDGRLKWSWRAPPGQRFFELIQTDKYLLLPHVAAEGPATLYLLSKGTGKADHTIDLPGRRLYSVALQRDNLLLTSDRGFFAYGRLDEDRLKEEILEVLEEIREKPGDLALRAILADRYFKLRQLGKALSTIVNALGREGISPGDFALLGRQIEGIKEEKVEVDRPTLEVQGMAKPPEIDGELNDWWREYNSLDFQDAAYVSPIQEKGVDFARWGGKEDLSARLYMSYDRDNFYFALDVRDSILRPYDSEAKEWKGDCLLIAIDALNNGGYWFKRDDTLLSLALTLPKKKKKKGEDEEPKPEGKYFVKRKEDGSGAIYEAQIPWAVFRKNGARIGPEGPKEGFSFGFNVILTDDDEGNALKALSWTPGVILHRSKNRLWHGFVPQNFGKVVLK